MNSPILTRDLMPATDTLELLVHQIRYEAPGINSYELMDPLAKPLPEPTAGSHVDVHLPGPLVRQYSLSNDPADRDRYVFAVLKDEAGRGGSKALHKTVHVQDTIRISLPRNNFLLDETASKYILLAGGIGITPFMAMIAELKRRRADFHLHYCSRNPERTAFREELSLLAALGRVTFHYDGGDPAKGLDVAALLREPPAGTHLYYCGPAGLMDAVARAATHWPPRTVHCEYFTGPAARAPQPPTEDRAFRVRLIKSGAEYEVPPGETIIDVLRRHGVTVRTSCELGYCGTCLTPYRAGEPDHRDPILSAKDRERYVLICCSRAKTSVLELEL